MRSGPVIGGDAERPGHRVLMKVGARDRAQLVVIAYETGFIVPG
jgi:hypothetical protein